jgi:hypothetical protein
MIRSWPDCRAKARITHKRYARSGTEDKETSGEDRYNAPSGPSTPDAVKLLRTTSPAITTIIDVITLSAGSMIETSSAASELRLTTSFFSRLSRSA